MIAVKGAAAVTMPISGNSHDPRKTRPFLTEKLSGLPAVLRLESSLTVKEIKHSR